MIGIALALLLGGQAENLSAGKIISNVLAHYDGFKSLIGTIQLVTEAASSYGNASSVIKTEVQFEKPKKFYLRQELGGKEPHVWTVISDGVRFSQNLPRGLPKPKSGDRLIDTVDDDVRGIHLDVPHIYAASVNSIGDRSAVLGIAVGWRDELKRIVADWPTHELAGEVNFHDARAWKIVGKFKEVPAGAVIGDFVLIVDKSFNILLYQTLQDVATPIDDTHFDPKNTIHLMQTWTVNLQGNGSPNQALFHVGRGN